MLLEVAENLKQVIAFGPTRHAEEFPGTACLQNKAGYGRGLRPEPQMRRRVAWLGSRTQSLAGIDPLPHKRPLTCPGTADSHQKKSGTQKTRAPRHCLRSEWSNPRTRKARSQADCDNVDRMATRAGLNPGAQALVSAFR